MIALLVVFMVITSGSFFASSFFQKRFEELVIVTIFSIVLVLYLFGLFGRLKLGVFFVTSAAVLLYSLGVYRTIKYKNVKALLSNIFTPAFFIFLFLYLVIIFSNYNRVAYSWDEFSHWADIVKAMYTIDDFGTSPKSFSEFQSYPPAMSLFQYFVQVINGSFSEWLLYVSYQVFFISLFIPFLKKLKFKYLGKIFIATIFIGIIPSIFFHDIFNSIYIDGFLGLLFGFSLALIYVNKKYDLVNIITIIYAIFILVLTKDAGLLFAIITLITFVTDLILFKSLDYEGKHKTRIIFASICAGTSALVFSKVTWNFEIFRNKANTAFSAKIDIKKFLSVLVDKPLNYRNTTNYTKNVLDNFIDATFAPSVQLGSIMFSPIQIIILLIIMFYVTNIIHNKIWGNYIKRNNMIILVVSLSILLYYLGLLVTYMFKFSEYEAIRLASFNRYISIIFTMAIMFIFLSLIQVFVSDGKYKKVVTILLLALLMITPFSNLSNFIFRKNVYTSVGSRVPYNEVSENFISSIPEESANIFILSQEDTGYDYWTFRYILRPHIIGNSGQWSIGIPFYEGDIWTKLISAEEWQQLLVEKYDYLIIYKLNDYFISNYATIFSNPDSISTNSIYKVNKDTGLLDLVEY